MQEDTKRANAAEDDARVKKEREVEDQRAKASRIKGRNPLKWGRN